MALNLKTKAAAPAAGAEERSAPPIKRPTPQPRPSNGNKTSGFVKASSTLTRRMIVSLAGEEKSGKNHTAFTAPSPIFVHSFDVGLEGVIQKFQKEKDIYVADYELEIQPGEATPQEVANAADKVWSQFVSDYRDGLASCGNGTSVIDTDTEAWELLRLARFGKLTQVMPHHYGPVNAEFRDLVREAYGHPANVFLLGKLVDEWENYVDSAGKERGKKTGRKARKGFSDIPFLVQVVAVAQREEPDIFTTTIMDCRQSPSANGQVVPNDYDIIAATVLGDIED